MKLQLPKNLSDIQLYRRPELPKCSITRVDSPILPVSYERAIDMRQLQHSTWEPSAIVDMTKDVIKHKLMDYLWENDLVTLHERDDYIHGNRLVSGTVLTIDPKLRSTQDLISSGIISEDYY